MTLLGTLVDTLALRLCETSPKVTAVFTTSILCNTPCEASKTKHFVRDFRTGFIWVFLRCVCICHHVITHFSRFFFETSLRHMELIQCRKEKNGLYLWQWMANAVRYPFLNHLHSCSALSNLHGKYPENLEAYQSPSYSRPY